MRADSICLGLIPAAVEQFCHRQPGGGLGGAGDRLVPEIETHAIDQLRQDHLPRRSHQGIAKRWAHLPEWPQVLLRALLFRLAVHALHPGSTEQSLRGLERAAAQITELL